MSRLAMLKLRSHTIAENIVEGERTLQSPHVSNMTKEIVRKQIKGWKIALFEIDSKIDAMYFGG
jgi:hypothetical protein